MTIDNIEIKRNIDLSPLGLKHKNISLNIKKPSLNKSLSLCYLLKKILQITIREELSLYIVTGDSDYRENIKLANYFKLWKYLDREGIIISKGEYLNEIEISRDKGIKYFGAIKLNSINTAEDTIKLLNYQVNSHLLILPKNIGVHDIIKYGFTYIIKENKEYLLHVSKRGGLALFKEGEFDDMYCGFIGIGNARIINYLENIT
ncbi:hypothetical protein F9B74_03840 [Pelistega sp. NLN82]|uniref:Uncharacterized protein n=1 Tax=Pelistega ratti TaxID=2652177 RepID=A0A6L9Y500_9BURK|nr:hypothetical protein [Pelistega ratti]NEN75459.1 hypothetical protein [Pelistega ratti]